MLLLIEVSMYVIVFLCYKTSRYFDIFLLSKSVWRRSEETDIVRKWRAFRARRAARCQEQSSPKKKRVL